ncbi:MAG: hypothetical protein ABI587_16960 [Gemmatimonadales bacterium]
MTMAQEQGFNRIARALYFVAFLLVVTPLMDLVANVYPLSFGDFRWRYGASGLLSGFLMTPLLGVTLGIAVAAVREHRLALRIQGVLAVVAAVLLLVIAALFALDALQLRREAAADIASQFDIAILKAEIKHGSAILALLWLGVAAIRTSGRLGSRRENRGADPSMVVRR